MNDFIYAGVDILSQIGIDDSKFSVMAQKACSGGTLYGFKPLTPKDVEAIYRMCL